MSDVTKRYRNKTRILRIISICLNVIPMLIFLIAGFKDVETYQKVVLSFTAIAALVLGIFMIISKLKIKRSVFWICFLVIYLCMKDLYVLIIVMGICTIIDEIIITPLLHAYSDKTKVNKEIDKRLEA